MLKITKIWICSHHVIGRIIYEESGLNNMYFISTKYQLIIVDITDEVIVSESFTVSKKEEGTNLVKLLNPPQYVLVAVMEISPTQKMLWVEDYAVGSSDILLDDLFDYIYDSINYYNEAFQKKWS